MTQDAALDILKQAILLEKRGMAFYRKIAEETENSAVECFFRMMADEEGKHITILSDQFKAYQADRRFSPGQYDHGESSEASAQVLGQEIREKIASAEFEAAAISAAVAMEQRSVDLYTQRAEAADDPGEKALYRWLSQWEREHLNTLIEMDRELTEKIWHDQGFWPF